MAFKEIKSLTGIRGLAAIYVIIFHWTMEVFQKKQPQITVNHYLSVFLNHGYLSVDLFFVLSGFVLCLTSSAKFSNNISTNDYKSFMYKRFSRIFPLYVCMTLVYFFLFHVQGIIPLIINLTLLQGIVPHFNSSIIPPGWSLTNEWVIYFVFPFLFYFTWKIRKKSWILILASFLLLVVICTIRGHFINWMNYDNLKNIHGFYPIILHTRGPAAFLRAIVAYLLGIFAYLQYDKTKERSKFLKYLILPLFALLFFDKADILIILLLPVLILYITEDNILSRLLSTKVIHFLGLISYSLYVNHYLFIETYAKVSNMVGIDNNIFSFSYVLIGTLVLSVITYYTIEKPGMAFLKRKFGNNGAPNVASKG
jgi:peptidoglycan/LPS O-acetylase OafA/YrhL